ncbi:MAG: DUF4974 domain-containing protein [Marinifilaceae bacterium]|nr:DUF4974 domain-containing protein [Marinifilaceae bacterium]
MSTNDEKTWLRAILEGKVKPGDEAWERIWRERDFWRVRRTLKEVGMMERGNLEFDREKMWRAIEAYRGEGRNARRRHQRWYWAAAVILPLLVVGGTLYFSWQKPKQQVVARAEVIESGSSRATLVMAGGERVDLASLTDTLLRQGEVEIRLDSSRGVTYQAGDAKVNKVEYNKIIVPRKGEYQLILADGSKVYLNSESELRFPTAFPGKERRVYLKGEGYFEVAANAEKPFIVTVGETDVRVLGTKFNIKNYQDEQSIVATLVEGTICLSISSLPMRPGQQSIFNKSTHENIIREVDTKLYTAWKDGRFIFKSAPLESILKQLSRWYDIYFEYEDENLKNLPFSGNVRKYEDGNIILELLKSTGRINFIQNGKIIYVKK